jgi:hypothetical protein
LLLVENLLELASVISAVDRAADPTFIPPLLSGGDLNGLALYRLLSSTNDTIVVPDLKIVLAPEDTSCFRCGNGFLQTPASHIDKPDLWSGAVRRHLVRILHHWHLTLTPNIMWLSERRRVTVIKENLD